MRHLVLPAALLVSAVAPSAFADSVIADDQIIQGSACVGVDCVNNSVFGFSTLVLSENNTRLRFDDTSSSAAFPRNDWEITANDTFTGGNSYLAFTDVTAGRIPFRVMAGAPAGGLYLGSDGSLGFGTESPLVKLHALSGNSPALRLEQSGDEGFSAQAFDLVVNESGFALRDVTNGQSLPVRVLPGAPGNSLVLDASGQVGIGTEVCDGALHVLSQSPYVDANAQVVIENAGTNGANNLLMLRAGATFNVVYDDGSTTPIVATYSAGTLGYAPGQTAAQTITFDVVNGSLVLEGDLVANTINNVSSRQLKHEIVPVEVSDVLQQILTLDVFQWVYRNDPQQSVHLGPMAEDFFDTFALGNDGGHLNVSDLAGVALAGVKALAELAAEHDGRVAALEAQNRTLMEKNAALEARLARLERLVGGQKAAR